MIGHNAEAKRLPTRLLAAFLQRPNEAVSTRFLAKDVLAVVATIYDMVDGTGILDPHIASHRTRRSKLGLMQMTARITRYH
jgi:hypothetical protein